MWKYRYRIAFIMFLVLDLSLYFFYLSLASHKRFYPVNDEIEPILLQIKEFDEKAKEDPLSYFKILDRSDVSSSFSLRENILSFVLIDDAGNRKSFLFSLPIEQEEEVSQEKEIIHPSKENATPPIVPEAPNEEMSPPLVKEEKKGYFEGYHDVSVKIDSSIHDLVYLLTKDLVSDQNITVDYAMVNLSATGSYDVFYYVGDKTYPVKVFVEE